jgi:hypothetical protein
MPTGKQVKSSAVNVCFVETRSKLMFVTAGNDKWSIVEPTKPTLPPARLLEQRLGVLESLHCPVAASSSSLASSMGLISQSIAGAGTAGPTKSTGTITKPPVTGAGITSAATSALFHAPTSSATTTSSAPAGGGGHAGRGRGLACLLAGASALVTLLSG